MLLEAFNLTDNHIALLNNFYISYNDHCEYGAPEVNPKRPYGNSYVVGDIAEILQIEVPDRDEDEGEYDEFCAEMNEIHKETATALQIVLQTKSFEPGRYVRENYSKWKKDQVSVATEIAKLEESIELKRRKLEEDEYQLQMLRARK